MADRPTMPIGLGILIAKKYQQLLPNAAEVQVIIEFATYVVRDDQVVAEVTWEAENTVCRLAPGEGSIIVDGWGPRYAPGSLTIKSVNPTNYPAGELYRDVAQLR